MNGELWYYTGAPDKTSDRPHPVTVRLALLSPVLAVLATIISIISLYSSQQTVKIGQRAYVSVKDGSLWTSPNFVNYKFNLHNLGNTPASAVFVKYLLGRDNDNGQKVYNEPIQLDIGLKDIRAYEGHLDNEWPGQRIRVVGFAYYDDVFGRRHYISWCWLLPADSGMKRCDVPESDWKIFGIPE
jgi:hypothetical protein